ncbi:zinc finger CCHC domain-containing protein 8 homolog [Eupeodes corollae]|uniref:zinc finger CCHC domain-containing protein 8 homolog n=1 Tax=Eupeodes corollae TaxID=290404 RepID=UPI002491A89A|nr:zinc finger CCHC domain-containing protein 8 homolog [Eupeodes corollae]
MGSKRPKNIEQITLSDSDCEIQEIDTKSITIPDSPEASAVIINNDEEQDDHQSVLLDTTNENEISKFNDDHLVFEVNFKNEELFTEYKELVLESLCRSLQHKGFLLVEGDSTIQVFRDSTKAEVDGDEQEDTGAGDVSSILSESVVEVKDESRDVGELKKEGPESEEDTKPSSEDDDMGIAGLFMVDTQPAEKVDAVQIPSYKRTIKEILNESSAQKKKKNDEDECSRPKQMKSCFNCGEHDHDLRSCPKPRNNAKINKAKKNMNFRRDRYHVDIEQRFAHLRPGQVSKLLREALGIRGGELPFFFYRMRVLGYPPGWLEDARVAHSGISLFDSEGRSVRDPEEEEGQVDADKNKYDVNKIIAFPGFNASPGQSFYDDYKHHNVPPMNREDAKEKFIESLGDNVVKGYKRKKLIDLGECDPIEKPSLELSEMDIDDGENTSIVNVEFTRPPPPPSPPQNADSPAPPPPPPPVPEPDSTNKILKRSPSPTLEDLQEKQKRLLRELMNSSAITISDNEDSLIDEVLELETGQTSKLSFTSTPNKSQNEVKLPTVPIAEKEENTNSPVEVVVNIDESQTESESLPPQTPTAVTNTMESVLGTPLLKFSPFDKLPCGDNFKVGVSDVINFENLPDSTGTYEKMKGVIKKVRTIVTKLNSEDS